MKSGVLAKTEIEVHEDATTSDNRANGCFLGVRINTMEPLVLFMDSLVPADVPRGYRHFCTLLVDASKLLRSGKHTYYGCAVSRLAASLHIDIFALC